MKEDLVKEVHLLKSEQEIKQLVKSHAIDLITSDSRICYHYEESELLLETEQSYRNYLLRKAKELNTKHIKDIAASPIHQAACLVASKRVDAGLAGCVLSTADVLKAVLVHIGCQERTQSLSGAFVLSSTEKSENLIFSDCAVIIEPNERQLVEIASLTSQLWQQLFSNYEPKLAFLSFSTHGSAKHPRQGLVEKAFHLFKQSYPEVLADGELQFDAAYVEDVAERKCPSSPIKGKANCFIFPSLEAANIAYKITQRLGSYQAFGPILLGPARAFSDLSRGANTQDIIASAMITMLRSATE